MMCSSLHGNHADCSNTFEAATRTRIGQTYILNRRSKHLVCCGYEVCSSHKALFGISACMTRTKQVVDSFDCHVLTYCLGPGISTVGRGFLQRVSEQVYEHLCMILLLKGVCGLANAQGATARIQEQTKGVAWWKRHVARASCAQEARTAVGLQKQATRGV